MIFDAETIAAVCDLTEYAPHGLTREVAKQAGVVHRHHTSNLAYAMAEAAWGIWNK